MISRHGRGPGDGSRLLPSLLLLTALAGACLDMGGCQPGGHGDIKAFTSDGCSLFPDGTLSDRTKWCDCCFAHDIAYWRGGTKEQRKLADGELRDCVEGRTGSRALAELMYEGVRSGGHPAFPAWYRWGYGWPYGRGYMPLTESEETQAREKLGEYTARHPKGYCSEPSGEPGS